MSGREPRGVRERFHYGAVRTGLLVALDGLALWFLGFILAAYNSTDALPWASGAALFQQAGEFTRQLGDSPLAGPPEILASIGLGLLVIGPTIDWIVRPLLARRDVNLTGSGSDNRGKL